MDPLAVSLLCDPDTHSPLILGDGFLLNPESGKRYPIRNGIPSFSNQIDGSNRKYQKMYDRLAVGYDFAESLYKRFSSAPDYRREYIAELEIPDGGRVLEVSVGTGANLRYLRCETDFFGLDLSWGMLRRCHQKFKNGHHRLQLFHGEAERLPFRSGVFDCVFHVGGINFFNDRAAAIREMIRVAHPGTKIVIVDETEKAVTGIYQKNPLTRSYFKGTEKAAVCPVDLLPPGMQEVRTRQVLNGKLYCLTFRTPLSPRV